MTLEEIKKCDDFASWWMWYPDLALDLMAPAEGSIKLHLDQRVFMRAGARFLVNMVVLIEAMERHF